MQKNYQTTYFLLRLGIGISMFGHGLVRLPKITEFAAKMVENFKNSLLPELLVFPFGYVLPILELLIGILLILGLFTRYALIAGSILMCLLIFGTTMVENWGAINSQLLHLIIFSGLISFIPYNQYAVDSFRKEQ